LSVAGRAASFLVRRCFHHDQADEVVGLGLGLPGRSGSDFNC
jgi:hypothetical protein